MFQDPQLDHSKWNPVHAYITCLLGESAAEETAIGMKIGEEDQRLENEKVGSKGKGSTTLAVREMGF